MIEPASSAPKTTTMLALAIVLLIAGTEVAVFKVTMPQSAQAILQVIVGVLIAKFGTVYDFYFGGSKGGETSKALAASALDKLPSGDSVSPTVTS
jgi:hypothetical protein